MHAAILHCAMSLILSCAGGNGQRSLNAGLMVTALADTYTTQRLFDLCRTYRGCDASQLEDNPLARPAQRFGKFPAYALTVVGVVAANAATGFMRQNRRKWVRVLAPIVQGGLIAASGAAIPRNVSLFNRKLAECGRGCRLALGMR